MVAATDTRLFTVDEYLALEREEDARYEYIDGHVYLMAGGMTDHSAIAANLIMALGAALHGGPCRVFTSDAKVQLSEQRYVYPDASVSCDRRDRRRADAVRSAVLVVEVLSPSTEAYDRGKKMRLYRACPTIQECLLVNTDEQVVEVFRREDHDVWSVHTFGAGEDIELTSVGLRFPVDAVYADLDDATDEIASDEAVDGTTT